MALVFWNANQPPRKGLRLDKNVFLKVSDSHAEQ
jgi:hypothetical protein